jgi:signal transduction histidine kinase
VPIKIAVADQGPMTVKINRGKLTQVIDNLVLNSDYWLREDLLAKRIDSGTITLRIISPHIIISDNGHGIDPSVEGSLFEPFVSLKKDGRGLGLYVAQQLLDSEGCVIRLRPRRNSFGRFYQFEIDMSGCMVEGET